jgi:Ca2+-binding RTX toxin-like protein
MFEDEIKLGGGKGTNQIFKGTELNERITSSLSNDYLFGGAGNDSIFSGRGNDTLKGDYQLNANSVDNLNNDYQPVTSHNDTLNGFCGNDVLVANKGADVLIGGNGMDILINQADLNPNLADYDPTKDSSKIADDVLIGGKGQDAFKIVFDPIGSDELLAIGNDTIIDFENNRDILIVNGANVKTEQQFIGNDNVLTFTSPDGTNLGTLTLLDQDNFIGF